METEKTGLPKTTRLLSLFERLAKGEVIKKGEEATRFNVDAKSIQRDIEDLRVYFQEVWASPVALSYYRAERGYRLERQLQTSLTAPEILLISKILLESRSLAKNDMTNILNKLASVCKFGACKAITEVLRNEQFHYFPVRQGDDLISRVWEISRAVRERRLLELTYQKEHQTLPVQRTVEPLGIIFSEYYFYLVANIHDENYPFPAIYRIDRIAQFHLLEKQYTFPYTKRFEEGEFRKRIQFMKPGPLEIIRFRFWGDSPEAALDRFPNAKILQRREKEVTIEAEVFGGGVLMWLLSQAEHLEVLEPKSLRDQMKKTIERMMRNYSGN